MLPRLPPKTRHIHNSEEKGMRSGLVWFESLPVASTVIIEVDGVVYHTDAGPLRGNERSSIGVDHTQFKQGTTTTEGG
jgi:hypothetical protein